MRDDDEARAGFYTPDTDLFLLSGESVEAVRAGARELSRLASMMGPELDDLSDDSRMSARPDAPARAAVVAGSPTELREQLSALEGLMARSAARVAGPRVSCSRTRTAWWAPPSPREAARVGFVFPGMGSQRLHMGRALLDRFDWAQRELDEAERHLRRCFGPSIARHLILPYGEGLDAAQREAQFGELSRAEVAVPAITFVSALWCRFFDSIGVRPSVVAGEGAGGIAAFFAAGAVDSARMFALATFFGRAESPEYNDGGASGQMYMRANGPAISGIKGGLRAKLLSALDGRIVPEGTHPNPYFADWVGQKNVDLAPLARAMAAEVDLSIEVGPGQALSTRIAEVDPGVVCLPVEPVPGRSRALHVAAAALFAHGATVDWNTFYRGLRGGE